MPVGVCSRRQQLARLRMADAPESEDELQEQLNSQVSEEFNRALYDHLAKRPEYETSELYSSLRKRQDVDDPLYNELKDRRDMLTNTPEPNDDQTPTEVIELVLRALRDVDWPRPGHGVDCLMMYSGPASILGEDRPDVRSGTAAAAQRQQPHHALSAARTHHTSDARHRNPIRHSPRAWRSMPSSLPHASTRAPIPPHPR